MDIENIKTKIYYYELNFVFRPGENLTTFFNTLSNLAVTRARIRYNISVKDIFISKELVTKEI